MTAPPNLAGESWLQAEPVQRLLGVLEAGGGEARIAGGAVRNALLGEPIADIDIATTLTPDRVGALAEAQGMSVHPTGLEHGTVTVVVHDDAGAHPFEVTTLRVDVETFGRHARVAFTDNWAADAARRDFTINALYCDRNGKIYDSLGGLDDIKGPVIRFAGDARARIREDYLRILRYFRFHARYAQGEMDEDALRACDEFKAHLGSLSGERVRAELLKLVVTRGAVATVSSMVQHGVLQAAYEIDARPELLARMADADVANGLEPDAELRLAVLGDPATSPLGRLRLSNDQMQRLTALNATGDLSPALTAREQRVRLYQLGPERFRDGVRYQWALGLDDAEDPHWRALLMLPDAWAVPEFPVHGEDLIGLGMTEGPHIGQTLRRLEDWWIAADFKPGKAEILAQAAARS
jgi:poly(A) polymerase